VGEGDEGPSPRTFPSPRRKKPLNPRASWTWPNTTRRSPCAASIFCRSFPPSWRSLAPWRFILPPRALLTSGDAESTVSRPVRVTATGSWGRRAAARTTEGTACPIGGVIHFRRRSERERSALRSLRAAGEGDRVHAGKRDGPSSVPPARWTPRGPLAPPSRGPPVGPRWRRVSHRLYSSSPSSLVRCQRHEVLWLTNGQSIHAPSRLPWTRTVGPFSYPEAHANR